MENLKLDDSTDLKTAFTQLEKVSHSDYSQLLERARSAYLQSLAEKVPVSSFEHSYEELVSYLTFSNELASKYNTEELIEKRCIETTRQYIKGSLHLANEQVPPIHQSPPTKYLGVLIDNTIIQHITVMLSRFSDTAVLVSSLSAMRNTLLDAVDALPSGQSATLFQHILSAFPGPDNFPHSVTSRILPWLVRVWEFLYKTPIPGFDAESKRFTNSAQAAETLWIDGRKASEFFKLEKVLPRSANEIQLVFQLCETNLVQFEQYDLLPTIVDSCYRFVSLVYLLILRRVVDDAVPLLPERIQKAVSAFSQS